ncbi:MAG: cytochrome P450 [Chloracidobacterium sp.]|uniref:Cytochrome P450 n=1 Tax=Chloracidobacterium validum TaxID=2821543 RepID=A0ABX8BD98_9BACT|nr:cytochrome P450 [Chloracidobacterium validum]QUW03820.1 cytochrome P450 [Chloracidobacterium validum]
MEATLPTSTGKRLAPMPPDQHWLFGSFLPVRNDLLNFYTRMFRELGDIIRFRGLPGLYWHLVLHPAYVEHVLLRNQQNYRKGKVFDGPIGLITGNGLLTSDGDFWRRQRKLMQPSFHRQALTGFVTTMAAETETLFARWDAHAHRGEPFDVAQEMAALTLGIAGLTLFSTPVGESADAFGQNLRTAFDFVGFKMRPTLPVPLWVPTPSNLRFKAARRRLDAVVYQIIERRRKTLNPPPDLLTMLMAARDEDTGEAMSDLQLRDEVITLLLAGHETTAITLTWAFYVLTQEPVVAERLYEEVRSVLRGAEATVEDLRRLPYTRMVIEETMRLYPPAWGLPREAINEDEIGGYYIPGRTLVALNQFLTHRHPDFWEDPERFDPERFSPERAVGRPMFAYFPFGGGQRVCIGSQFALMEATLVLAMLTQRYRFKLVPGHPIEFDTLFTLRPKHGVRVICERRAGEPSAANLS